MMETVKVKEQREIRITTLSHEAQEVRLQILIRGTPFSRVLLDKLNLAFLIGALLKEYNALDGPEGLALIQLEEL